MEPLRLDPVPARVTAWHNRHPLARRITVDHVTSLGYVALPFVQRPGRRGLTRGFDEEFLEGARIGSLARWAARHGVPSAEPPGDGPLREVKTSGERFRPGDSAVLLYVRTAFVDDGTHAGRVLLGGGDRPAVYGRRLMSRPRQAVAAALGAALIGGAGFAVVSLGDFAAGPSSVASAETAASAAPDAAAAASAAEPAEVVAQAASVAPAPSHAAPASPTGHAAAAERASEPAAEAAEVAQAAASAASEPARPLDVEPRYGRIELPSLRPSLGPPEPDLRPGPPPPPAIDGPAWALATRATRSEADTEQTSVAIGALLQRAGLRAQRVQVVDLGKSRHVVIYPFANRSAADNARSMLAARGFATEAVEF